MTPAQLRRLHAAHGGCAVILGALLFVICLSGTLAIVADDLRQWAAPAAWPAVKNLPPMDQLLGIARSQGIAMQTATLELPRPGVAQLRLSTGRGPHGEGGTSYLYQPGSHTFIAAPQDDPGALILALHGNLFLGFPGRILAGLLGMAMSVMLLGGMFLALRSGRKCLAVRLKSGWQTLLADSHRFLGVCLLPLILFIALTGTFAGLGAPGMLALSAQAYAGNIRLAMTELMGAPPEKPDSIRAAPPSVDAVLARHRMLHPEFRVETLALSNWGHSNAGIILTGHRAGHLGTPALERLHYPATRPTPPRADSTAGKGAWVRLFGSIQPLHYGRYLGNASRLINAFGGIVACVLIAGGLWLWFARRRMVKGAAWQAAGRGLCAGICIGLPGAMIGILACTRAGIALPVTLGTLFWGLWLLILVLCTARPALAICCLHLAAGSLGLLGLADLGLRGAGLSVPAEHFLAIDTCFCLFALALWGAAAGAFRSGAGSVYKPAGAGGFQHTDQSAGVNP